MLDNCEHLIGACAKTADAILRRCPRVSLLATSREPLGIGGESIYRVPPLSLPGPGDVVPESCEAVALFVERAREQGVDLSVDEKTGPLLVSICRRLDGLPLAIELAAARLRSLSLSSLRDRLDQRFRLLTGGSRTALARQQTLRAAVDWSYSLLNRAEQSLLQLLSVFAESFDLDAVEASVPHRRHRGVRRHRSSRLAGGQEPRRGRTSGGNPPLPAARDHPAVCRRAARRGRRTGCCCRRSGTLCVLP